MATLTPNPNACPECGTFNITTVHGDLGNWLHLCKSPKCGHRWSTQDSDTHLPPELEQAAIENAEVRCPHCNTVLKFSDLVVTNAE